MTSTLAVHAEGPVKRYGDLTAVDHLDLEVGEGEVSGILDRDGASKTTFLRMLPRAHRPDAGSVAVLAALRKKALAF
ncbi:MAG: hypothetical protein H0V22_05725 [Solirubrobacterales bacterium]|nr:hypothetical protein [Solirubrobacterales bacterium]